LYRNTKEKVADIQSQKSKKKKKTKKKKKKKESFTSALGPGEKRERLLA